jgi:hypothetical protein
MKMKLQPIFLSPAKEQNYSTQYSRVVPHHSTDWAITSLTSQIGRDAVLSSVYGRS